MFPFRSSHATVRLAVYVIIGVICGATITSAISSIGISWSVPPHSAAGTFGDLLRFKSESQLREYLKTKASNPYIMYGGFWGLPFGALLKSQTNLPSIAVDDALRAASEAATGDFSRTNVQVEGVDEADIIKTDGKFIYYAQGQTVYIVLAYPVAEAKLVSKINIEQSVSEIYIYNDKLVLFTIDNGSPSPIPKMPSIIIPQTYKTVIKIYDISNRENPKFEKDFKIEGNYVSSRLIGEYLYMVIQKGAWLNGENPELPVVEDGSTYAKVQPTDIYYSNSTDSGYSYTMIVSINVQNTAVPATMETFLLGFSTAVYVSTENLYLVVRDGSDAEIHKINLVDGVIKYIAEGKVPGWVLNQFSMDESNGYFRIATTAGKLVKGVSTSTNNLYILDETMKTVGKLEDLALGESIYSTRFMGNRCYLVTFKKVDPFFVIDLSNPKAPMILGKLKIPGYNNYLHPYDENHIIGIGKETVESETGDFAWYQGIKISLFDVSDIANPKEVAKIEIGDRGSDSPALSNHKAFLFSQEKNLLILPILEAKIDPSKYGGIVPANVYGDFIYQGAYIFNINTSKISLEGRITHIQGDELTKSGYWFNSEYEIERSIYIGEIIYTISSKLIKANNLSDLKELASIELH